MFSVYTHLHENGPLQAMSSRDKRSRNGPYSTSSGRNWTFGYVHPSHPCPTSDLKNWFIFSQRLLPRADGTGVIPAVEVLEKNRKKMVEFEEFGEADTSYSLPFTPFSSTFIASLASSSFFTTE